MEFFLKIFIQSLITLPTCVFFSFIWKIPYSGAFGNFLFSFFPLSSVVNFYFITGNLKFSYRELYFEVTLNETCNFCFNHWFNLFWIFFKVKLKKYHVFAISMISFNLPLLDLLKYSFKMNLLLEFWCEMNLLLVYFSIFSWMAILEYGDILAIFFFFEIAFIHQKNWFVLP